MRKATSIKEISGTLDLYNPTEANGAIVKIANFQAKPNVNMLPQKAPLSIVFFTKESVEKMAKQEKAEREAKMKQLDAATREIAAGLMALVDGFGAGMAGENELSFYVNGDIQQIGRCESGGRNGQRSTAKRTLYLRRPPAHLQL